MGRAFPVEPLRLATSATLTLALLILLLAGDTSGPALTVGILAISLVGGLVSGSWLSLAFSPLALFLAQALLDATDCPDCGGGGEEMSSRARFVANVLIVVVVAVAALPGVVAAKRGPPLLRRAGLRTPAVLARVDVRWLALLPLVTVTALIVGLAIRDARNADLNGPVIASSGTVNYRSGPKWDGKGSDHTLSRSEVEAFSAYPLYWLGNSFAGFNLRVVQHLPGRTDVVDAPGADIVTFIYGFCGPAPCPAPVQVATMPGCAARPSFALGNGPEEPLPGGAVLERYRDPGHVILWTGPVSVHVHFTSRPEFLDELIASLHRPGMPAGPLPPPDFSSCP